MGYVDKTLKCAECGTEFTFDASEQEFYANKGFTNEPKRCPSCRQSRRQSDSRGGGRPTAARDAYCGMRILWQRGTGTF